MIFARRYDCPGLKLLNDNKKSKTWIHLALGLVNISPELNENLRENTTPSIYTISSDIGNLLPQGVSCQENIVKVKEYALSVPESDSKQAAN
jgi:hypothetical protein